MYSPTTPIRSQVTGLTFGLHSSPSLRSLSSCEITSPVPFDNLGNPLPGGLYDARMGTTDEQAKNAACVTCGMGFQQCPGHLGHIELCVPVYNPLTFSALLQFLKAKCQCCHKFRVSDFHLKMVEAKLSLIENNRTKEAMELDDVVSTMLAHAKAAGAKQTTSNAAAQEASAHSGPAQPAAGTSPATIGLTNLISHLSSLILPPLPSPRLTSHERQLQRDLVKSFLRLNGTYSSRCQNCSAFSGRVRHDAYNKVFRVPLSKKSEVANRRSKCKITPAEGTTVDAAGVIEFESDSDDDGSDSSGSGSSGAAADAPSPKKADQFMTPLEVIAQVKLTWSSSPSISSRIFGSALSHTTSPWSIFFSRTVAVPPSRFRPPMVLGGMTVEHAQNLYLNKMLVQNEKIRDAIAASGVAEENGSGGGDGDDSDDSDDADTALAKKAAAASNTLASWIDLQLQVNCYFDSSKDPGGSGSTAPPGIRQLLERKEGIFRKHMMGKRVNYACRSVISPDPYIGTNEIGVPLKFARTLDYPTPVTSHNVEKMRSLVTRGAHEYPGANWVEDGRGVRYSLGKMSEAKREAVAARLLSSEHGQMKVGRQLEDGDSMLVNRQVRNRQETSRTPPPSTRPETFQ